jgi:hypothetical protein
MEHATTLTPEESLVEQRTRANLEQNRAALAEAYWRKFGNEISTDNAREIVSPEYAASKEGRTRWSRATQKPAGALAEHLFEQALQHPDPARPRVVLMTSGGTGAGKTTALRSNPDLSEGVQFVYDSNLGSKKSSVQKIDAARGAGNQVRIIHVLRNPVEALTGGVLPRAMEEGRVVDLDAHARMYRDSTENIRYLTRRFASDPGVDIRIVDNRTGEARVVPIEDIGGIRYSTSDLRSKLRAALENEYDQGRISEAVYRATLGPPSAEAPGGVPRDSGPGGPQAGGRRPSAESPR